MYKTLVVIGLTLLLCAGLAACTPNNDPQESATSTPVQSEWIDTNNNLSDEAKSILYENLNIGFSMQIPSSWEGKYSIEELDRTYGDGGTIKSISLSHNATMDELGFDAGWLFSVSRVTGEDFTEDEPPIMSGQTIILAQTGGYTYFIHFPSGVEYNEDPKSESAIEYKEIVSQVDLLINTFKVTEIPDELNNGENMPDITNIASLTLDDIGVNDDSVQLIQHIPEGKIFAELVEIVVTLGDGRVLAKSYEGFWFTSISHADLLGNGQQELVLNLYYFGSNYSAMDCHVLGVKDGDLVEMLTILDNGDTNLDADRYKETLFEIPQPEDSFGLGEDGRADICTGVSVIDFNGKSALKVQHIINELVPYTVVMWDGLAWSVAEQGVELISYMANFLYGTWVVSKFLGFDAITKDDVEWPDGEKIVGKTVVIGSEVFSTKDFGSEYERYAVEIQNPVFQNGGALTGEEFSVRLWQPTADKSIAELTSENITLINPVSSDFEESGPALYIIDNTRLLISLNCDYFELVKVSAEIDVNNQ